MDTFHFAHLSFLGKENGKQCASERKGFRVPVTDRDKRNLSFRIAKLIGCHPSVTRIVRRNIGGWLNFDTTGSRKILEIDLQAASRLSHRPCINHGYG
jgi:hypothetical protein